MMAMSEQQALAELWPLIEEMARSAARDGAPSFIRYAITTGDAATPLTVNGMTTQTTTAWLDGVAQTAANKSAITLQYGQAAPAAGQLWLVLLPNYKPPGVFLLRLA